MKTIKRQGVITELDADAVLNSSYNDLCSPAIHIDICKNYRKGLGFCTLYFAACLLRCVFTSPTEFFNAIITSIITTFCGLACSSTWARNQSKENPRSYLQLQKRAA